MTYPNIQNHYKVPEYPGICGMCGEIFDNEGRKIYFCGKCRSKPVSEWREWMFKQNAKAKMEAQRCQKN